MTCTAYGTACAEHDVASYPSPVTGRIREAHSFDRLVPELNDPVIVTIAHDAKLPCGVLVDGEINSRGELRAITVCDDWVLDYDGPLYFSAELLMIGPGIKTRSRFIADVAGLAGLSITDSPAVVASQPLKIVPGDIRRDRSSWPISWRSAHRVLERAAARIDAAPGDPWRHVCTRLTDVREEEEKRMELLLRSQPHLLRHGQMGRVLAVEGRPPRYT